MDPIEWLLLQVNHGHSGMVMVVAPDKPSMNDVIDRAAAALDRGSIFPGRWVVTTSDSAVWTMRDNAPIRSALLLPGVSDDVRKAVLAQVDNVWSSGTKASPYRTAAPREPEPTLTGERLKAMAEQCGMWPRDGETDDALRARLARAMYAVPGAMRREEYEELKARAFNLGVVLDPGETPEGLRERIEAMLAGDVSARTPEAWSAERERLAQRRADATKLAAAQGRGVREVEEELDRIDKIVEARKRGATPGEALRAAYPSRPVEPVQAVRARDYRSPCCGVPQGETCREGCKRRKNAEAVVDTAIAAIAVATGNPREHVRACYESAWRQHGSTDSLSLWQQVNSRADEIRRELGFCDHYFTSRDCPSCVPTKKTSTNTIHTEEEADQLYGRGSMMAGAVKEAIRNGVTPIFVARPRNPDAEPVFDYGGCIRGPSNVVLGTAKHDAPKGQFHLDELAPWLNDPNNPFEQAKRAAREAMRDAVVPSPEAFTEGMMRTALRAKQVGDIVKANGERFEFVETPPRPNHLDTYAKAVAGINRWDTLRAENRRVGEEIAKAPPEWAYPLAWRLAVMSVVEHLNNRPTPKAFEQRTRVWLDERLRFYHEARLDGDTANRAIERSRDVSPNDMFLEMVCAAYERGRPGLGGVSVGRPA